MTRARTLALALSAPLVGCLIPDLGTLSGGATGGGSADSGFDGTVEAAVEASVEASVDGAPDAGPPCSNPAVLVGSSDVNGIQDTIPPSSIDSYGYAAAASGSAQCVWLYLDTPLTTGAVQIGVYSPRADGGPQALLAQASVTVKSGWTSGVLDKPVPIVKDDVYWLALLSAGGTMVVRVVSSCPPPAIRRYTTSSVTGLPGVFNGSGPGAECNASAYLGR